MFTWSCLSTCLWDEKFFPFQSKLSHLKLTFTWYSNLYIFRCTWRVDCWKLEFNWSFTSNFVHFKRLLEKMQRSATNSRKVSWKFQSFDSFWSTNFCSGPADKSWLSFSSQTSRCGSSILWSKDTQVSDRHIWTFMDAGLGLLLHTCPCRLPSFIASTQQFAFLIFGNPLISLK